MRQPKTVISIGILVVLALHLIPIVSAKERKTLWPILEWTMYKDSRPAGPIQANTRRIVAVTARGEAHEITPRTLGSSGYAFGSLYLRPIGSGDSLAAQDLLRRLNATRRDSFVEIRLESETHLVTDSGIVERVNPVLRYPIRPSPSK